MKTYTVDELAATIDHAVLKAEFTQDDLRKHAAMCAARKVASMCVRPCDVALAVELLSGSGVPVSCVLSFPHGDDTSATKVFQAEQAIADGVREIDMVMNVGQFLSGKDDYVRADIKGVVDAAHASDVLVKVILETCYLSDEQIARASVLCEEAGADFVKTSTGFGSGSATPEAVAIMVKTVGGRLGVKASGGIRCWDDAVRYLQLGATRLGMGATAAVLDGAVSAERY